SLAAAACLRMGLLSLIAYLRLIPPCRSHGGKIAINQITNTLDRKIGRRIVDDSLRIERVVSLAWEDSCKTASPNIFHGGQDAQLVIDHDIVPGRIALFDVIEHLLLMNVNKDPAVNRLPQS